MCAGEAPDVARSARRFGADIAFVGVAGQDSVAAMRAFVADHDLTLMPHVADVDGALSQAHFQIQGHSSWIFIDGETGEFVRHVGPLEAEALDARLTALQG